MGERSRDSFTGAMGVPKTDINSNQVTTPTTEVAGI
jgi:hypothetical protein